MDLNDFITFNPLTDNGYVLPKAPGNYLVTIRDIKALPTLGCRIVTRHFRGQELIYTGITKTDLYHRIWKSHIGSHAGRSTLRLTLGCLLGYKSIPRDKHNPDNGKVRFSADDERELRTWMKENLVFHCQTKRLKIWKQQESGSLVTLLGSRQWCRASHERHWTVL